MIAFLRVLFLGLVLLSAGHWGLVNGTIAGKRWNWYPGSSGCQTLYPNYESYL